MPRKIPFSGKAKKAQLQAKRLLKKQQREQKKYNHQPSPSSPSTSTTTAPLNVVTSFGASTSDLDAARYSTFFLRENDHDVQQRRIDGSRTLQHQPCRHSRESPPADFLTKSKTDISTLPPPPPLTHPIRPHWNPTISAEIHEQNEQTQFEQWLVATRSNYPNIPPYELNLEVWRQLWRVCEFSQTIVVVADIRCPTYHISPSLMHELLHQRKKHVVILLNKTDLVTQQHIDVWKHYLEILYPSVTIVECSSSPPPSKDIRGKGNITSRRKYVRGKGNHRPSRLQRAQHCSAIAHTILKAALAPLLNGNETTEEQGEKGEEPGETKTTPTTATTASISSTSCISSPSPKTSSHQNHRIGTVDPSTSYSIGLIGQPNTGKSSVLNLLVNKKLRSTSRTAGHTKWLQHIPLNIYEDDISRNYYNLNGEDGENVINGRDIYLIDCPGLVFPQQAPRHIGEMLGLYPIAQVREYNSVVRYVAERIPIETMYNLKIPDWYDDVPNDDFNDGDNDTGLSGIKNSGASQSKGRKSGKKGKKTNANGSLKGMSLIVKGEETKWTPRMILESYSEKKSYYIGKGGVPDTTRAGSELLKDIVDGILLVAFVPPAIPLDAMKKMDAATTPTTPTIKATNKPGLDHLYQLEEEEEEEEEDNNDGEDTYWQTRLTTFYTHYNKSKVSEVDTILEKYAGKELKLIQHLIKKYGPEPVPVNDLSEEEGDPFTMHIIEAMPENEN